MSGQIQTNSFLSENITLKTEEQKKIVQKIWVAEVKSRSNLSLKWFDFYVFVRTGIQGMFLLLFMLANLITLRTALWEYDPNYVYLKLLFFVHTGLTIFVMLMMIFRVKILAPNSYTWIVLSIFFDGLFWGNLSFEIVRIYLLSGYFFSYQIQALTAGIAIGGLVVACNLIYFTNRKQLFSLEYQRELTGRDSNSFYETLDFSYKK